MCYITWKPLCSIIFIQLLPTLISTWKECCCALSICCSAGKKWHSHFHRLATLMINVSSLIAPHGALNYSAHKMAFLLCLWIFYRVSFWASPGGLSSVDMNLLQKKPMHVSECQCMRRWVTHWVMMEKREDRFPQGTKCSLCPLPHVHHQLHNLYLYTSPLETVSIGVIYRFNRSFFMFASNYRFTGVNEEAARRKQHRLLQTEGDLWLKKGLPHLVHVSLHVCTYRVQSGGAEKGERRSISFGTL